ncbi:MAG TPA: glycine cleavage system protein GcvH [Herpetosiphonaceae bacterium]
MAYNTPDGLKYAKSHEWIKVEGDTATIGISDYAQHALGDIVFVELPDVGASFGAGDSFGVVESVKAASDVYLPVSGEVVEINEALLDAPETVNSDPYGAGWLVKITVAGGLEDLLDKAAYEQVVEDEASK